MLMYGVTREGLDETLNAVLQTLHNSKLSLNQETCEFGKDNVRFLGHIVGIDGIKIDIQAKPPPSKC